MDDVTRDQAEIECNVSPRRHYLDREDLSWEPAEDNYLSLQRRLFFMTADSFNVETRYILDEKLRRLKERVGNDHHFADDITSLNHALNSMRVAKEDHTLYFPDHLKDGRVEF